MPGLQYARAKLIPMNGDQLETDVAKHIQVQFNPATLRVTLANTMRAENRSGSGGPSGAAAQFVEKSESTLAVELVFDTSAPPQFDGSTGAQGVEANSDVRKLTQKIADTFMKPQEGRRNQPLAPKKCRFQWGTFMFTGMLSAYNETLDFFAPEGIPLRATLSLTFKEDGYQFELDASVTADKREVPRFVPTAASTSVDRAAQNAGVDPRQWRLLASFNSLENPRFTVDGGIQLPPLGGL